MKIILNSDKVSKDIYTKLYSDIQYNPGDYLNYLKKSVENIKDNKVDYVFFLGDLLDDSIYDLDQLKELIDLIKEMVNYTKVILILGNHDQFTKSFTGKWQEHYNIELTNILKRIGVTVLQNQYYIDENINVYGMRFPGMYYERKEPKQEFINNVKNIDFSTSDKFNILLEHSPYHTFNKELVTELNLLNNVDLVLAGHYHNGCIPWYIGKFIPGNKGLIDPYMQKFPDNARGEKYIVDDCLGVISTPVTTFSSKSKVLSKVNKLYIPRNQDIIIRGK